MKLYSAVLLSFVFLASCSRYIRWANCTFKQADKYYDDIATARSFIRSSYVYDQFNTVSLFDVLWLSQEVRLSYADLYAHHWNISEEKLQILQDEQRKEAQKSLSFYVLLAPDDDFNVLDLNNPLSRWSLTLRINGKNYKPVEIQWVDGLVPEYRSILSTLISPHKRMYFVRFNAFDHYNNPLITTSTQKIELIMRSPLYETSVCWSLV